MLFEICWIFSVHLNNFTSKLFNKQTSYENSSNKIDFLAQSINLQGNDKVMWMLLQYFDERKKLGDSSPEEDLIDDEQLRMSFIRNITS